MTINAVQGSLVLVGVNTDQPKLFWHGAPVPVTEIMCHARAGDSDQAVRVVVPVGAEYDAACAEMVAAGIRVRRN